MREGDRGKDYRDTPGEKGVNERGRQREGLQVAPRKKETGKWRKGLDHIQGRDYHQTSPTSPNTVSTNQTTKLSHSPTTPNPRRDTPGEKGVGERGYGDRGKGNTTVKDTELCSDKCQKFMQQERRDGQLCI